MSIKKLFDDKQKRQVGKILVPAQANEIADDIESPEQIRAALQDKFEFVPGIDYSEPANFVKFGSAYRYYVDGLEYIADYYPYDGTSKEKLDFYNNFNPLEKYLFDTEYPTSTGYAIMGANYGARGAQHETSGYYAASEEFIHVKGGPNASSKLKADGTPDFKDETANIFYTGSAYGRRSNNLEFGGTNGDTIEFFFKKSTFSTATSTREVIYDAWNGVASDSAGYGRFTVEIHHDVANSFFVSYQSGSQGVFRAALPVTSSGASLADGNWHHYAFAFTSGSDIDPDTLFIDVYKDGTCFGSQISTGSAISQVTGAIEARIGALITAPSGTTVPAGYGKLAASLDEFRVWKDKRTSEDIGRNWFTNIHGGTNTRSDELGDSLGDTELGLYFKFNEGITGQDSTDNIVLDYSGRISNGAWTGFTSGSRNTGSALVSSSASEFENEDPIVRKNNSLYVTKKSELSDLGNLYDYENNASLYYSMPDWIINEDSETNEELLNLTQIMASYLDTLYSQTSHLFKIGDISYASGSDKPFPYNERLLQSMGFEAPELFSNASLLSHFLQKDEKRQLEFKLHNIKNEIYKNIYNNLSFIYKSKGTAKAFRNLVRCYGVGDELFSINTYVDNETYRLDQTSESSLGWYLPGTSAKKYVDMTGLANRADISASVFTYPDPSNANSYGFISGDANLDSYAFTLEAEVYFPRKPEPGDENDPAFPNVSASLFGFHTPSVTDPTSTVTTWAGSDYGLQVYAVHTTGTFCEVPNPIQASRDAKFVVKNSAGTTLLTSDVYTNVYDNKNWKFALSLRPTKYPYAEDTTGTTLAGSETYILELYAVNSIVGEKQESCYKTATLSYTDGSNILESGKRIYVGAHRTNFTGSLIASSGATDIRASGIRWWNTYLPSGTIDLHSYDVDSFGLIHPYRNVYNFESNDPGVYIPEIQTLALNWDFITVSGSDGSGEFVVTDFSSGSAGTDYEGSYQGAVFSKQNLKHHTGKGIGFATSSIPVKKEYVYSGKQRLPEQIYPEDMVEVKNSDEETFTRESKPYRFFFAVEKSMYDSISKEMLEMFASIQDFNNLIGEPVNKYRLDYKDMKKLQEIFFRRIGNTPDLDKFIDYYKWLDSSMGVMIEQLFPASAKVAEGVRVMVENHVLERNKYYHKYPTLEEVDGLDPEAGLRGSGCSNLYGWKFNHAPIPANQDTNCGWWYNRAERTHSVLASGVPTAVQNARNTLLSRAHLLPVPFRNKKETLPFSATSIVCLEAAYIGDYIGGVNQEINKIRNVSPFVFDNFETAKDCDDEFAPNEKKKVNFRTTKDGRTYPGDLMSPFSIYSSSVGTGYRATLVAGGLSYQDLSNMHEDSYHPTQYEVPMQGPFTKQHVGGLIYRNNKALLEQNPKLRGEGFTLAIAGSIGTVGDINLQSTIPKGQYYRGLTAKSPVNMTNILSTTASAGAQASSSYDETASFTTTVRVLGNYSKNYEVVHTQDRNINNLNLRDNTSDYNITGAASAHLGGLVDYEVPHQKSTYTANKTVFAERFSAPGGIDTSTPAFLDVTSQQFSSNNALPFRNIGVRVPLRVLQTTRQSWGGFTKDVYPEVIVAGHATLEELNTGSYTVPVVSYHKTQRNILTTKERTFTAAGLATASTKTVADNEFVTHPIPQADRYHWFQAINKDDAYKPYDTQSPARNTHLIFIDHASNYPKTFGKHGVYLPVPPPPNPTLAFGTRSTRPHFSSAEHSAFDGVGDYRLNATTAQSGAMVTSLDSELIFRWSSGSVFPIWKALRTGETSLGREPRETNTYTRYDTVATLNNDHENNVAPDGNWTSSALRVSDSSALYRSAPVTSKHKPMFQLTNAYVGTAAKDAGTFTNVSFRYTYGNEFQGFAHQGLNEHLGFRPSYGRRPYDVFRKVSLEYAGGNQHAFRIAGIKEIKQFIYEEVIYPKDIYTYLSGTRDRTNFENSFWRDNGIGTASAGTIAAITTSGSILSNTASYNPEIPRISDEYSNSQGYVFLKKEQQPHKNAGEEPSGNGSGSIWPMDSFLYARYMSSLDSDSTMAFAQGLYAGELMVPLYGGLQWDGTSTPELTSSNDQRSAQYVYTVPTITSANKFEGRSLGGPTTRPAWTAGDSRRIIEGANRGDALDSRYPFYDTYDDFAAGVRLAGQDHTLVPEYRASEHVFTGLDVNNGDWGLLNTTLLDITGTAAPRNNSSYLGSYERPIKRPGETTWNQADPSFIERWGSTELFTYLQKVMRNDSVANGPPTDLRLTARTVQKVLPYDGFYPVHRSTQIATLFSQSISPGISFTGTFTGKRRWQNILKPFFAPGILFNSIKSGVAVDHPVRGYNAEWSPGTDSWDDQFNSQGTANPLAGPLSGTIASSSPALPPYNLRNNATPNDSSNIWWYRRQQFESLIDPLKHIAPSGEKVFFLNDDVNAYLLMDATGSLDGDSIRTTSKYKEYKSGIGNFCGAVPDFFLENEGMSKLVSNVPDPDKIQVEKGKTYVMEVVLRKTDNFNMYSNPYAFGVPTATGSKDWDTVAAAHGAAAVPPGTHWPLHRGEFAPFTPPYFYGDSVARIVYKPQESLFSSGDAGLQIQQYEVSLREILADINDTTIAGSFIEYFNSNDSLFDQDSSGTPTLRPEYGWNRAWLNKMNISASIVVNNDYADLIGDGYDLNQWVIMPKWETPILDFPRPADDMGSGIVGGPDGRYNFSASVDAGNYNSGTAPEKTYGMWHQYGMVPETGQGVKLIVRGLPKDSTLRRETTLVPSTSTGSAEITTLTFNDSGATSFDRNFWIYTSSNQYFIKFTVQTADSTSVADTTYGLYMYSLSDPSPTLSGVSSSNRIGVDIASSAAVTNATEMINKIKDAIAAKTTADLPVSAAVTSNPTGGALAVSADGGVITITNGTVGAVTDATSSWSGIVTNVTQQGTDAGTTSTSTTSTTLGSVDDDQIGNLASLLGFRLTERELPRGYTPEDKVRAAISGPELSQEVCLGRLAKKKIVHEAIVALPYYITGEEPNQTSNFLRIPPTPEYGPHTRRLIEKMERYNLPPALEQNLNQLKTGIGSLDLNAGPLACYIFEFSLEFSKQDLADIWQGIMPEQSKRMLGKRGEVTAFGLDHTLVFEGDDRDGLFGERIDNRMRDLLSVQENFQQAITKGFKPEIQWMVFKVKQRGISSYEEMIRKELLPYTKNLEVLARNDASTGETAGFGTRMSPTAGGGLILTTNSTDVDTTPRDKGYNWPYDYFSFIELAKIEGQVRFRPHATGLNGLDVTYAPRSPGLDTSGIGIIQPPLASQVQTTTPRLASPEVLFELLDQPQITQATSAQTLLNSGTSTAMGSNPERQAATFRPHIMISPNGVRVTAQTFNEHERLKRLGYLHEDEIQTTTIQTRSIDMLSSTASPLTRTMAVSRTPGTSSGQGGGY